MYRRLSSLRRYWLPDHSRVKEALAKGFSHSPIFEKWKSAADSTVYGTLLAFIQLSLIHFSAAASFSSIALSTPRLSW
jgi:hypothetical protein